MKSVSYELGRMHGITEYVGFVDLSMCESYERLIKLIDIDEENFIKGLLSILNECSQTYTEEEIQYSLNSIRQ